MRTRFKKVWCSKCATMQFAGECGHARLEAPDDVTRLQADVGERGVSFPVILRRTARAAFDLMSDECLAEYGLRRS